MRIIFSRKGFDSASGGVPNPIFPDGRLLSLPIPSDLSPICYQDIRWHEYDLGTIVSELTDGKILANHGAHLDPDLISHSLPRHKQWRPIFGQIGAAQGHLRNQKVKAGDIFLFFGLFRETKFIKSKIHFDRNSSAKHIIWGWLQIDEIVCVDACKNGKLEWAKYHPHFHSKPDETNTVYTAKRHLEIESVEAKNHRGAGVFNSIERKIQLTAPHSKQPSLWQLPDWFFPNDGKPSLTYHGDLNRWRKNKGHVLLKTVGRGQEFVLDCSYYPEAKQFLDYLIA